jgi:hypothetical protein
MKHLFFTAALAVIVSMGFTSCKKCQVCTKNSSPEIRICEKDYSTNTEYGLALDAYEANGYNCKNSL